MNLTLHIVIKDLIRMRGWIACWVALLSVPILIGIGLLARSPFDGSTRWTLPNTLAILTGVQLLLGYLLTVLVFQEDGVVGSRQFWLTRPIARGRMLGAKAIGALLIVGVVPVVVCVPWWLWCGFGVGQMAHVAMETIGVLSLVVVAGALVAVLTDSLPRAMLWSIVLVVVGLFGLLFFTIVDLARPQNVEQIGLQVSRLVIAVVAVSVQLALVVVLQFFIRRRGGWLVAAGVALFGSVMIISQQSWGLFRTDWRERHPERAARVEARFVRAIAVPIKLETARERLRRGGEVWQTLKTEVELATLPAAHAVRGGIVRHRWVWPDGTAIERSGYFGGGNDPAQLPGLRGIWASDPETIDWLSQHPQGGFPRDDLERERALDAGIQRISTQAYLRPSLVQKIGAAPPAYRSEWRFRLVRPRMRFEAPLSAGAAKNVEGFGFRIDRVERTPVAVNFTVVESEPRLLSGIVRKAAGIERWLDHLQAYEGRLIVINRSRREAVGPHERGMTPRVAIVFGVEIRWREITVDAPKVIRGGKWVPLPGWLDDVTIGATAASEEAIFEREVQVPNYLLSPGP